MVRAIFAQVKNRIASFYDDNPYVQYLGMKLVKVEAGQVQISLQIVPKMHANVYHVAHGGALMSLADTAMGAACLSVNKKVVTIDMNINCIKAVPENKLIYAMGKIIHNGAHTLVAECEVTDDTGKLYAKARGSFYVLADFIESAGSN